MAHTDLIPFEKLAVGYSLFNNWEEDSVLTVTVDSQLRTMIERAWKWRQVFREEGLQIIKLIDEREWGLTELKNYLARPPLSLRWDISGKRIDHLVEREFLERFSLPGKTKPTAYLRRGPQWPYRSV
jgi:hypothetical protein